ncbi:hypothetical protein E5676_scaffold655G00570 [Cucumis melo var. makuwa]|uniref:Uncharacterized protein n=1 Tax=Cucumis melo var. makuwa TaxID=1194695 RepID=A0A5D3E0L7_CUCMM|nr:hypothetical protein E5676_scaffold655G00570 [Cucumis melo var. makuwa]
MAELLSQLLKPAAFTVPKLQRNTNKCHGKPLPLKKFTRNLLCSTTKFIPADTPANQGRFRLSEAIKDASTKANYKTLLSTKLKDRFSSSESGDDTKRRSYAEAVIKGSSSDEETDSWSTKTKKTGKILTKGKFQSQVIVKTEGKWHLKRNPSIHGTFTREAARRFDEFNLNSEQYFFEDNLAISPEKAVLMVIGKEDWKKKGNSPIPENNKKLGAMMDFLNYDGDSDSSEKRKMEIEDEELTVISQKEGKFFIKGKFQSQLGKREAKERQKKSLVRLTEVQNAAL